MFELDLITLLIEINFGRLRNQLIREIDYNFDNIDQGGP